MSAKAKEQMKDRHVLIAVDNTDNSKRAVLYVADFLGGYGWRVLEHLSYQQLAERYVKPTARKLVSMALERVVYAEKL